MADQNITTSLNYDADTLCERANALVSIAIERLLDIDDDETEQLVPTLEMASDLIHKIGPTVERLRQRISEQTMAYPLALEAPAAWDGEMHDEKWNPRLREFIDSTAKAIGAEAEATARERLNRLAAGRVNHSTCDEAVEWLTGYVGQAKPLLFTRYDMKILETFLHMTKENVIKLEGQLDRARLDRFGESADEFDAAQADNQQ